MSNAGAINQLGGLVRAIRSMDDRADDLTPVWPRVGAMFSRNVRRQFSTKGAYLGTPWKPLSARTVAEKLGAGYPLAPLVRTGALKFSFIRRPMDIEVYEKTRAHFGSNERTSIWQHYGTFRHGKRHIPPRKILVIRAQDRAEVKRMIARYVTKGK